MEETTHSKATGIHRLPYAALDSYLQNYSTPASDSNLGQYHKGLREATAVQFTRNAYQAVSSLQGQTLRMLVSITGARRILELGCFTGQSALWLADGAIEAAKRRHIDPASIELVTCERDPTAAALAQEWIDKANLTAQVTIEIGHADTILQRLNTQKPFDLIFLDANKNGYISYLTTILECNLLADHGFIIADNVLFRGDTVRVANTMGELFISPHGSREGSSRYNGQERMAPDERESASLAESSRSSVRRAAMAMHQFNSYVAQDDRVEVLIWPLFDGLSIIQKRL
ncbi:S-adenosyl-L-methionine-dependent methyltransferase [Syncephalis fuscata]|nr:S-adenosyl-L-methionine-dependent methyltransferase [Syncephalis fuscata]